MNLSTSDLFESKKQYVNNVLANGVNVNLALLCKGYKIGTIDNLVETYGTNFISTQTELISIGNNMFVMIIKPKFY
jgi:hypothetical protein